MENLIGQTIHNLLVLEQETRPRAGGRGKRDGAVVRCTTCERQFNCRCDELLRGTVTCVNCRGTLPS